MAAEDRVSGADKLGGSKAGQTSGPQDVNQTESTDGSKGKGLDDPKLKAAIEQLREAIAELLKSLSGEGGDKQGEQGKPGEAPQQSGGQGSGKPGGAKGGGGESGKPGGAPEGGAQGKHGGGGACDGGGGKPDGAGGSQGGGKPGGAGGSQGGGKPGGAGGSEGGGKPGGAGGSEGDGKPGGTSSQDGGGKGEATGSGSKGGGGDVKGDGKTGTVDLGDGNKVQVHGDDGTLTRNIEGWANKLPKLKADLQKSAEANGGTLDVTVKDLPGNVAGQAPGGGEHGAGGGKGSVDIDTDNKNNLFALSHEVKHLFGYDHPKDEPEKAAKMKAAVEDTVEASEMSTQNVPQ